VKNYRKILCLSIYVFAFLLVASVFSVRADAAGTVTVEVSKTFVRESVEDGAPVLATAAKGSVYSVVKTVNSGDVVWYEVLLRDGVTKGYIRADLVTFDSTGIAENAETEETPDELDNVIYVEPIKAKANTDVRVRKGASTKTAIVETITRRTEVTINYYMLGSDGLNWYHVAFDYNGETVTGYIRSDLVTLLGILTVIEPEPEIPDGAEIDIPVDEPEPVLPDEKEKEQSSLTEERKPEESTSAVADSTSERSNSIAIKEETPNSVNVWMIIAIAEAVIILALIGLLVFPKMKKKTSEEQQEEMIIELNE